MCPFCSGRGHSTMPITETQNVCRLCDGEGFLTPAVEEAFWDCAGKRHRAPAPCVEEMRREGPW